MKISVKDQDQAHQIEVGVLDENGDCTHMFTDTDSEDRYGSSGEYLNSHNYTYCLYCGAELITYSESEDYYDED